MLTNGQCIQQSLRRMRYVRLSCGEDANVWCNVGSHRGVYASLGIPDDHDIHVQGLEGIAQVELPDADRYFANYGLTSQRLAAARPDAIVMHPQPMNRGIEIASDVADGPRSAIRDQVRNGVAVRMAVLAEVMAARGTS